MTDQLNRRKPYFRSIICFRILSLTCIVASLGTHAVMQADTAPATLSGPTQKYQVWQDFSSENYSTISPLKYSTDLLLAR